MTKEQKYSLVMQYAAGGTLEELLLRGKVRSWRRVWQIAMEITRRLQVIHETGLVHCDLHPGNIVFNRSGDDSIPLIIDFGASKPLSQFCVNKFNVNFTIGRLEYIPPEFFRCGDATQRYDIYDLGLLLWQLTARFPPVNISTLPWNPSKGLHEEPVPGTPKCYRELYKDCWRSDPFSRPTVADVLRRLADYEAVMMAEPWLDTIPEAIEYFTRRGEEFKNKRNTPSKPQAQTKSTIFMFVESTVSNSFPPRSADGEVVADAAPITETEITAEEIITTTKINTIKVVVNDRITSVGGDVEVTRKELDTTEIPKIDTIEKTEVEASQTETVTSVEDLAVSEAIEVENIIVGGAALIGVGYEVVKGLTSTELKSTTGIDVVEEKINIVKEAPVVETRTNIEVSEIVTDVRTDVVTPQSSKSKGFFGVASNLATCIASAMGKLGEAGLKDDERIETKVVEKRVDVAAGDVVVGYGSGITTEIKQKAPIDTAEIETETEITTETEIVEDKVTGATKAPAKGPGFFGRVTAAAKAAGSSVAHGVQ
ncbi:kinase-like domain-containing protein, partial [Endogone sp. FLAS-F59071]